MGLSYYYKFSAPAAKSSEELGEFLKGVEEKAKSAGFGPTLLLNAQFDSAERRKFVRRLTTGLAVDDPRLKGVAILKEEQVWEHDPHNGSCHLLPDSGVLLILTDEQGCESAFGFFKYRDRIKDINGKTLAETRMDGRWYFSDFVDSPDPRFREIVRLFARAGFLEADKDEFAG